MKSVSDDLVGLMKTSTCQEWEQLATTELRRVIRTYLRYDLLERPHLDTRTHIIVFNTYNSIRSLCLGA